MYDWKKSENSLSLKDGKKKERIKRDVYFPFYHLELESTLVVATNKRRHFGRKGHRKVANAYVLNYVIVIGRL